MIRGQEYHSIIKNIFGEVIGYLQNEQLQVNCPRCQEREGLPYPDGKFNLEINTAKRVFRCWKCDEPKFSGSLGKLIKIYGSSLDYEMYKSYAGIYQDYNENEDTTIYESVKLPSEMILFSQMDIKDPEHFEAYSYIVLDRKIPSDIIFKYRLGFCTTGKYAKRIIVPSFDTNGEVNYFVARTYDLNEIKKKRRKYLNPPLDKNKIIFNEGYINWDFTVYLVEGVFDMLSIPINTIPMLGKTISSSLFLKLNEFKPNVVILLDPDAYKNAINLYYTLYDIYVGYEDRVKIVKLPTDEDIDELRKNKGIDMVIKSLRTARGLTINDYFMNKMHNSYGARNSGSTYFNSKSIR